MKTIWVVYIHSIELNYLFKAKAIEVSSYFYKLKIKHVIKNIGDISAFTKKPTTEALRVNNRTNYYTFIILKIYFFFSIRQLIIIVQYYFSLFHHHFAFVWVCTHYHPSGILKFRANGFSQFINGL